MLVDFWIGDLTLLRNDGDRKEVIRQAAQSFEAYLVLLEQYDILTKDDVRALERYRERPASFSVAATTDPVERRETKIAKYKQEKALKEKLEVRSTAD